MYARLIAAFLAFMSSSHIFADCTLTPLPADFGLTVERHVFGMKTEEHPFDTPGFGDQSTRYQHGVFGESFEYETLNVGTASFTLNAPDVFEDRDIRRVDVDGNGQTGFLVIAANAVEGARLMLFDYTPGPIPLLPLGQSAPIGIGNRWLNPVGVGDFNGDGVQQIASVRTPHIGGILEIHELKDFALHKTHSMTGVSNHAYGSPEQHLSIVVPGDVFNLPNDVMVIPDQARSSLHVVAMESNELRIKATADLKRDVHYLGFDAANNRFFIENNGDWFAVVPSCFKP